MNTTSDTPSSIGLQEAAARFEALSDQDNTETSHDDASETAETEQVEATAADTSEDETPPDNADSEADTEEEGAEEEEATDEPDDQTSTDPLDQTFTVKVNGKEEVVTLKEALNGYQRTADYTRKSMALSEDRKAHDADKQSFEQERQAIRVERQQYAQLLPVLVQQLEAGLDQEPNWAELLATKPDEYIRQEVAWREKQARLGAAREEQARLRQQSEAEQHQALQEALQRSGQELAKAMPEWTKPERWKADQAKLKEYGQQIGFSEQELDQTYDHRAVIALYKAMKYDELMAKRPVPVKPNAPKSTPSGSSNVVQTRTQQTSNLTRAKQRLAKTGRVADAASLFEQLDP